MPDGRDIVDVVAGKPGPKNDLTLFREERSQFDPQQKFKGDKAYVGEALIPHSADVGRIFLSVIKTGKPNYFGLKLCSVIVTEAC